MAFAAAGAETAAESGAGAEMSSALAIWERVQRLLSPLEMISRKGAGSDGLFAAGLSTRSGLRACSLDPQRGQ